MALEEQLTPSLEYELHCRLLEEAKEHVVKVDERVWEEKRVDSLAEMLRVHVL